MRSVTRFEAKTRQSGASARRALVLVCSLLSACASRAPLASTSWEASLEARPGAEIANAQVELEAATPSEPGDLYEVTGEDRIDGRVENGVLACRVSVGGDLRGLAATPDRIVQLSVGDRTSRFAKANSRQWDFSIGLVTLVPGDPVGLRVTDDRLGENSVVLQGTRTFDGGPIGWTDRQYGVRTSVRCRIPTQRDLERELARRLRRLDGRPPSMRNVAAITGWSDPRLKAAQMPRSRPPSTAND